jgi:hypothetical protein
LYDRAAAVKKLKQKLEGKALFVAAGTEEVDVILAVQGCDRACADLSRFQGVPIQTLLTPEDESKLINDIIQRVQRTT